MALFKVKNIIDGNTIEVAGWSWGENGGNLVRVLGYKLKDEEHAKFAKSKLEILLTNKSVELKDPKKIEKEGNPEQNVVFCSVYLNDIDIAQYFPELTTS